MTRLHSAVFGVTLEQARESAELRVLANNTVDLITSGTSTNVEADWQKIEEYLRACYRSVQRQLPEEDAPAQPGTYRLSYRWVVKGPIETVFHYVADARTFLDWFPVFKEVRPDDPYGELRVGSHVLCHVTALLPYVLDWDITVSRCEPPYLIETDCTLSLSGRLGMHGFVRYRFEQQGGEVLVINEQEMFADQPLPSFLFPLAQAAFQ